MKLFRLKMSAWKGLTFAVTLAVLSVGSTRIARADQKVSTDSSTAFANFDQRAKAGQHLNVAFFGASLTWGANASDPLLTSYRADVARRFEAKYPNAHFRFINAAIGGTGSQLGVFRLQRDVLRQHPDLVFLDFSANDGITDADVETLSSYESILRRIVGTAHCPVVQVIFPFRWDIGPGTMAKMKRRDAHLAISKAYHTGVGDAIALLNARIASGAVKMETIWPIDGVHPGDIGYENFADAAWQGYLSAVGNKVVSEIPAKMLYQPTYMTWSRNRISQLGQLPQGWSVGIPNRVSAYFDFLMSRWLDDEVVVSNHRTVIDEKGKKTRVPQEFTPLHVKFRGSTVMLFGECTLQSGKYHAFIDGQLVTRTNKGQTQTEFDPGAFGKGINGNGHHVAVIAMGLDPKVDHTLEIEPIFDGTLDQELRFESVCVAGGDAKVLSLTP